MAESTGKPPYEVTMVEVVRRLEALEGQFQRLVVSVEAISSYLAARSAAEGATVEAYKVLMH